MLSTPTNLLILAISTFTCMFLLALGAVHLVP